MATYVGVIAEFNHRGPEQYRLIFYIQHLYNFQFSDDSSLSRRLWNITNQLRMLFYWDHNFIFICVYKSIEILSGNTKINQKKKIITYSRMIILYRININIFVLSTIMLQKTYCKVMTVQCSVPSKSLENNVSTYHPTNIFESILHKF